MISATMLSPNATTTTRQPPAPAPRSERPAIVVRGLYKSYGDVAAVRGVDLTVPPGEVFVFVGPNGAGKTTVVEILEGYRSRDAGEVEVLGVDPAHGSLDWRARIGFVLQTCAMPPELTVRELVERYAGYYPRPRDVLGTIELVGLTDKRDERAGRLSGGQQRRLDVALALIGDPDLLFLDEPTTGFDPGARRDAWDMIAGLAALGKTIFLTTHYMDEAEALADRVAVIVAGRIVADGPPESLGGRARAPSTIAFALPPGLVPDDLPALDGARIVVAGRRVEVHAGSPIAALGPLVDWGRRTGVELADLSISRPTLEDVYLELTGGRS